MRTIEAILLTGADAFRAHPQADVPEGERPAAVAVPTSVEEVQAVVRHAAEHGLRVAVHTTGRGVRQTGRLSDTLLVQTRAAPAGAGGPARLTTLRRLLLLRESHPDRPAFDMAVSSVLLTRVVRGEHEPALRLVRHAPSVAFGRMDALQPGFAAAVAKARELGYEPFERLAGGRAAVYHEGVLTIGEALRDDEAGLHINRRYETTAETVAAALRSLGVDARVGAVAGEYCPGDFSVNARGAVKLSGTAQRVVRGGAYVGTVLVVSDAARVAAVVEELYAALGLPVDPQVTGAVADEAPGAGLDAVEDALIAAYAARAPLREATLDPEVLAEAAALEARFRPRSS